MTGFGRGSAQHEDIKMTVEMKSVNNRFLDINARMPRTLACFEEHLKALIRQSIARGRVDVFVNMSGSAGEKEIAVDQKLLDAYLTAAKKLERQGIANDLSAANILRLPDVVSVSQEDDEELLKNMLGEAAQEAIRGLSAAREAEGEKLADDIFKRLVVLSACADGIEKKAPAVVEEYAQKLKARTAELADGVVDEARLATEVAFFADRQDVTEEVVRIRAHVAAVKKALASNAPQGRQLDFLVQELNREFNTVGSKSADIEIVNMVLTAKVEVEKIREQVQNLE